MYSECTQIGDGKEKQAKLYRSKNSTRSRHKECNSLNIESGGTENYTRHTLKIGMLPKVMLKNTQDVADRVRLYFELCIEDDMKPTFAGFCLAMGMGRSSMTDVLNGRANNYIPEETRALLEQCYYMLTAETEQFMVDGKINPVAGIFLMRNNMGYTNDESTTLKIETQEKKQDTKALIEQAMALLEQKEEASE